MSVHLPVCLSVCILASSLFFFLPRHSPHLTHALSILQPLKHSPFLFPAHCNIHSHILCPTRMILHEQTNAKVPVCPTFTHIYTHQGKYARARKHVHTSLQQNAKHTIDICVYVALFAAFYLYGAAKRGEAPAQQCRIYFAFPKAIKAFRRAALLFGTNAGEEP
jgi:hypothetical protein